MNVVIKTEKINAVKFRHAIDFGVTLDWYNNWKGNPSGILQVSPSMEKVWDLKTLDGLVAKYSDLPAGVDIYATYEVSNDETINGVTYTAASYFYDGNIWQETSSEYSLLTYNEMFTAIADAAVIDVVAQEENLLYLDVDKEIPTGSKEYIQGAIGYQIYHIANNGQEENDADFNFEASISVQQGENTKQLVWEGLHSKVKTQLDLSHIGDIDIDFTGKTEEFFHLIEDHRLPKTVTTGKVLIASGGKWIEVSPNTFTQIDDSGIQTAEAKYE